MAQEMTSASESSVSARSKTAKGARLLILRLVIVTLASLVLICQISFVASSTSSTQASNVNNYNNNNNNNNNNASLPALSERANGLNSRYLSAGSTASLAAATVAAASNQQVAQNQNQQHQGSQHQQHQQQQQQQHHQNQVAAAAVTAAQNNNILQQHSAIQQQQQQTVTVAAASPGQYNPSAGSPPSSLAQSQQQPQSQVQNPPVMSTTHAYNPLIGQYLQNFEGAASQTSNGVTGSGQLLLQQPQPQQQQLPGGQQFLAQAPALSTQQYNSLFGVAQVAQQPQAFGFPYQTFSPPKQAQLYQRPYGFPFGHFAANSFPQQQQQQQRQPFQNAFSRRNGLGALRPQQAPYLLGNTEQDEATSGLLALQQQQQSGSISDQLAASLGLSLDPSYASLPSPSNAYLVQQQNGNQLLDLSGTSLGQQQQQQLASQSGSSFFNSNNQQVGNNQQQQFVVNANQGFPAVSSSIDYTTAASSAYQATKSDQCVAADGRHGTCYQASECIRRGGTPMGRCGGAGGAATSGALDASLSGTSNVCCLFDVTCGQFAAERFVYFRNPGYPANSFDQSRMCRAKIGKLDKGVCQFRLDMLRFDIAKPTNGNCSQDMFVVSGQNENYVIPKICGFNDGQHYYVGVDESGVITLHMMMMGYYRRTFEILITQIPCRSDFAAPAHCLQYFMGTHGTIKSFNYDNYEDNYLSGGGGGLSSNQQQGLAGSGGINNQGASFVNYDLQLDGSTSAASSQTAPYGLQFAQTLQQRQGLQQQQQQMFASPIQQGNRYGATGELLAASQFGGYPNDLDYTICIRKESGFCSISYQLSRGDQGFSPFAVGGGSALFGGGGGAIGHNDTQGWHTVSTECRDDYLLIGGVRLCSGGPLQSSNFIEHSFGQQNNGSSAYGLNQLWQQQQQQLQNQQNLLMQQLARLQQQQQQQALVPSGNASLANSNNSQQQQQQVGANNGVNYNYNLEQQQAAILQQLMATQQQLQSLGTTGGAAGLQQNAGSFLGPNRYYQSEAGGQYPSIASSLGGDLQSSIITDTTSGPFLLRFVSNNARNARGFHIDYRQNPCK